jgi:hypothetical protein
MQNDMAFCIRNTSLNSIYRYIVSCLLTHSKIAVAAVGKHLQIDHYKTISRLHHGRRALANSARSRSSSAWSRARSPCISA